MIDFEWKIIEISKEDDLIVHAKYKVIARDNDILVETEGNHWFSNKVLNIPFKDVKEEDIIEWIENESIINDECHIKSNLSKQVKELKINRKSQLPWKPQVFNVGEL